MCLPACVSVPLPLGQGGDEFAAEVGDVGDHAAPDRVGSSRRTLEGVSGGAPRAAQKAALCPGWFGRWCGMRNPLVGARPQLAGGADERLVARRPFPVRAEQRVLEADAGV